MEPKYDAVFDYYRTALDMSDIVSLVDILGPSRYVPEAGTTPVEELALYVRSCNDTIQLGEYSCDTLLSTHEDEQLILDALVVRRFDHTNVYLEVKDTSDYDATDLAISPGGAARRNTDATRGFATTSTVLSQGEKPTVPLPAQDDPDVATYLASPNAAVWPQTLLVVDKTLTIEPGKGAFPQDTIPHLPEGFKHVSWTGSQSWEVSTAHSVHGDLFGTETRAMAAAALQSKDHPSAVMALW